MTVHCASTFTDCKSLYSSFCTASTFVYLLLTIHKSLNYYHKCKIVFKSVSPDVFPNMVAINNFKRWKLVS